MNCKKSLLNTVTLAFGLGIAGSAIAQEVPQGGFGLVVTWLEDAGKCLDGNPGGFAFQNDCARLPTQQWEALPAADGSYFQLRTAADPTLCLEGGRGIVAADYLGGAAHLAPCGDFTGQRWVATPLSDDVMVLQNQYAGPDLCLEGNSVGPDSVLQGAAFMDACQNVAGQNWRMIGGQITDGLPQATAPAGDVIATEEQVAAAPIEPAAPQDNVAEVAEDAPAGDVVADGDLDAASTDDLWVEGDTTVVVMTDAASGFSVRACSVGGNPCTENTEQGYFLYADEMGTAMIGELALDQPKPSFFIEFRLLADGSEALSIRNEAGQYLIVDPDTDFVARFGGASGEDPAAQFRQIRLSGEYAAGHDMLESVAHPGRFLRHFNLVLSAQANDGSDLFARDSAWLVNRVGMTLGNIDWSYGDQGAWTAIAPQCGMDQQSPVDVQTDVLVDTASASPILFEDRTATVDIISSGYGLTTYGLVDAGLTAEFPGLGTYTLDQVVLHAPSEHRIDGRAFAAEQQLVYRQNAGTTDEKIAIVAILLEVDPAITAPVWYVGGIWDADFTDLAGAAYVSYSGSLTTPAQGCREGVDWFVLGRPGAVAQSENDAMIAAARGGNARDTQPLNGRTVSYFAGN
jgi:carbonic anhydrase